MGYLTALARRELSGQLNYCERNCIEKWFQTIAMRIDRFHSFRRGSQPAPSAGCDGSGITTIMTDRTKRSMDDRQPRRFSTRQFLPKSLFVEWTVSDGGFRLIEQRYLYKLQLR